MEEQFLTYKPKNEIVAKHISYYYFHQSFNENFERSFVYYPNFKNTITIHKDSVASRTKTSGVYTFKKDNLEVYYSSNLNLRKEVVLKGKFNKIGIVFTPLGLNYFLECALSKISSQVEFDFNYFGNEFVTEIYKVYQAAKFEDKVTLLDAFFESKYNPNLDERIQLAVKEIISSKGLTTSLEIADILKVSRKTVLRLFKTHLNCSVEDYKKLVRFRVALNHSQESKDELKLSDIAYDTHFCDQASLTNHFKSIIGKTPKSLFKNIEKLGEEDTYWTLKK
ncbi:hypothetical protein WH52_12200 [Tenacibaculum holothuriorum]|uniref:HTH araC/xylS-type domain-containing protein n=1 Tax=Tenacibaculum holothuriorum TaxID=1635173 RepID=A0A1Y2PC21_9FLAO|nr:AraC family transcriptional regulator [Tenacibaculum holothuriorum]OSY87218.1 hypothetical protein WH52_12200 [Tenacibaculum holothuriorum]